jgi:hypothetical protein
MKALTIALFSTWLPLLAHAQTCVIQPSKSTTEVCEETESFQSCMDRMNALVSPDPNPEPVTEKKIEQEKAAAPNKLDLVNTGDSTGSSVNDYLPLLRLLLDNGNLGGDDQKLGFEWSNPLGFGPKVQNKVFVALEAPEIYEPLKEAMQAASLTDELSTLEDSVDARDDITVGLSVAFASEKYGRDPRLHQSLLEKLISSVDEVDTLQLQAQEARLDFEEAQKLNESPDVSGNPGIPENPGNLGGQPFCAITKREVREEYMRLSIAEILAARASLQGFSERLTNTGFYSLLDLIDNQPQFSFNASYRSREEAAGPNETKLAISYEQGDRNLNDLRAACGGTIASQCIANFVTSGDNAEGMNNAMRLRFIADYTKISRLNFVMPEPGFSFVTEPSERLTVSAIYGRNIGAALSDGRRARLDASLSYEDFSDDPLRENRGVANVTLTYPIIKGFFLTFGAIYATKPEFRGDVDKEIGARAGITYKLAEDQ